MKKTPKPKPSKTSVKTSAIPGAELLNMIAGMTKLVERLETLEKKTDLILGRIPALSPQTPQGGLNPQRESSHHGQPGHNRTWYETICADCRKACEVPFRPVEGRPVYCKECFAARKSALKPPAPSPEAAATLPQPKPPAPAAAGPGSKAPKTKKSSKKKS